jgi:transcriptional regulator GlxA family with amidase domain
VEWLRDGAARGARFASVCTGAAALGEAGLLDGRRCTTHWSLTELMRQRYPSARVQDSVLYVHDGPVSTSAGFSTGIDLALSIVESDHGPALTAEVARTLVLYLRRDGSAHQVSPFLRHRAHLNSAVHRVQEHLAQHLDDRHTLADLATVARLSPRGLTRAFTTTIGMTPLEYQQDLRLALAVSLLTETDLTVEAVATRCGFRDPRQFRRLFTSRHGAPPVGLAPPLSSRRPSCTEAGSAMPGGWAGSRRGPSSRSAWWPRSRPSASAPRWRTCAPTTARWSGDWPAPAPAVPGRMNVAVVVGATGSVVTDVLAPYEVFARSSAFHVYTVSAQRRPIPLTGGLPVLPDHTFAEVAAGHRAGPRRRGGAGRGRPDRRPRGAVAAGSWWSRPDAARGSSACARARGWWPPAGSSTGTGRRRSGPASTAWRRTTRGWTGSAASATCRTVRSRRPRA